MGLYPTCDLQRYLVSVIYEWKQQILSPSLNYFFFISIALIRDLHVHSSLYRHNLRPWFPLNFRTVSFKGDIFSLSYIKAIRVDNEWEKGDTLWLYKRTKVSSSFYVSLILGPSSWYHYNWKVTKVEWTLTNMIPIYF